MPYTNLAVKQTLDPANDTRMGVSNVIVDVESARITATGEDAEKGIEPADPLITTSTNRANVAPLKTWASQDCTAPFLSKDRWWIQDNLLSTKTGAGPFGAAAGRTVTRSMVKCVSDPDVAFTTTM